LPSEANCAAQRESPQLSSLVMPTLTTWSGLPRILHLTHSLQARQGGTTEAVRQLTLGLQALGHEQAVLSLDAPRAAGMARLSVPVHALGAAHSGYGLTPHLLPWLRQHGVGFDAWLVHGLWQFHGLAARQQARVQGKPYFVFCHGMLDPWFARQYPLKHLKKWLYWPWGEYRVLRDAQAVLFASDEEARLAAQSFWLYRARAVTVGLGLALDPAARHADPAAFLRQYPDLLGRRIVLSMARLHPKKGGELLLRAFAALAREHTTLHLVMAGPDGDGYGDTLRALAAHLGIADRVLWPGMLQGAMKWSALRAAELFALPSHQENFGLAVVEALACATPVLISDQVNIWPQIVHAEAGWATPDTVEGTTQGLRQWLALSAAQRSAMSGRAGLCFDDNFQLATAAARLQAVLTGQRQLTSGRRDQLLRR